MEIVNHMSVALKWNAKGDDKFATKMASTEIFEWKSYSLNKKWRK